MLVLGRKVRERILLEIPPSDETRLMTIDVVRILECSVRLGFDGPREITIVRAEIVREEIAEPEQVAAVA